MKHIARKCRPELIQHPAVSALTVPIQSKLCDFPDVCSDELQLAVWPTISFIQRRKSVPFTGHLARVGRLTSHLGYKFPNDEREQDRLDIIHHIIKLVLNDRLFLAPIENGPIRVLDIGTGTGLWAIEFGTSIDMRLNGN